MFALARPAGPGRQNVIFALLGLALGVSSGAAIAYNLRLGVVVAILLAGLVVAMARPVVVAIAALVGVYASYRLGGAADAGGVSYSDALLAVATLLAVPSVLGSVQLRRLRVPLAGIGIYLAMLLPTIFLNPSHRAYLEWFHRLFLVGGAMIVGAWIVQAGATRLALRALIVVSGVIGVAAMIDALATAFAPAAPLGLNKNLVGTLLGLVIIVLIVAPDALALPSTPRLAAIAVIGLGLLATQSRGGMLGAAAGLLLAFALDWRGHRRNARILAGLAAAIFAGFVAITVHSQLTQTMADLNNSSIGVRFNVERVTRNIWQTSPVDGVGLKYFVSGYVGPSVVAPNNVIDNELAESGLIGLTGFALLQGTMILAGARRRRTGQLAVAGTCCVVGQLVHGMVDIYWSAGVVTLPFLLFGMGLACAPRGPDQPAEGPKISSSTRPSTVVHS